MSSRDTVAWANALADIIVYEQLDRDDIARLMLTVCDQADAVKAMRKELRRANAKRQEIMRNAARRPKPETGFRELNVGSHVTVLERVMPPSRVNGHSLDTSYLPAEMLRPRRQEDAD